MLASHVADLRAQGKEASRSAGVQAALSPTVDGNQVRHYPTLRIGCRLVHGFCDFWKAWHRGLFLKGTWLELPSYCYGFQRARRREGWWPRILPWRPAVATRVSLSLMRAWIWQMLSARWIGRRRKT